MLFLPRNYKKNASTQQWRSAYESICQVFLNITRLKILEFYEYKSEILMEYLPFLYFFKIFCFKRKLPGLYLELHCFEKLNTFVTRRDRICRLVMVDRNSLVDNKNCHRRFPLVFPFFLPFFGIHCYCLWNDPAGLITLQKNRQSQPVKRHYSFFPIFMIRDLRPHSCSYSLRKREMSLKWFETLHSGPKPFDAA